MASAKVIRLSEGSKFVLVATKLKHRIMCWKDSVKICSYNYNSSLISQQ